MKTKPLYEEIINEIGTQTLARVGLNIFNLNTMGAYEASAKGTINVSNTYDKHKNNENFFGYTFEDLDTTNRNIDSALHKKGELYIKTDDLGEINHQVTDVRKFDKYGNVIENSQHKVIKKSSDLFGKNNKYLENDKITVDKDGHYKHKNYYENIVKNSKNPETVKNAKLILSKLQQSSISREDANNPRTTAIKTQIKQGVQHTIQSGISDAVIVALSTLANGAIYEIKDSFHNGVGDIKVRITRLLKKVIADFKNAFQRGASYGALEIGVDILSNIFKSISSKITTLFKNLRTSLKSIYNAIYSYIKGEIKTKRELISVIIKGILSAIIITGSIALETKLEAFLIPILSPMIASIIAPILTIIISSIALVVATKAIDNAIDTMFKIIAEKNLAKARREEIEKICDEFLPDLIRDREKLAKLIKTEQRDRDKILDFNFKQLLKSISNSNIDDTIKTLVNINSVYGKKLQYQNFKEFDNMMMSNESFKF